MKRKSSSGRRTAKLTAARPASAGRGSSLNSVTMQIPLVTSFDDHAIENVTRLEIIYPKQPLSRIRLTEKEITIGRDSTCGISLPFSNVSRIHARITRRGEDFMVEDLNSTNGTLVNNIRIVSCILHDQDQIRIGEAKIFFFRQKNAVLQ